ncbi:MAG: sigma-70 family RNA polymerase sigma factor, partial [Acidimicrobiales bacterium]
DAAFQRHVVPEIPTLLRAARSLPSNAHDDEDLVQDTVIRAYRAIDRFDGAHARAWLFTIMRNTHINRNRKRRPGLLHDPRDAEAIPSSRTSDPADVAEQSAFREAVLAAISKLPEKNRVVVELVDLDSCSYAEVALALAVPIGTVMSRLHRGRRQIRDYLTKRGFAPKKGRSS